MKHDSDIIFALATGPVASAIAVLRVSGAGCAARLQPLFGRLPPPRQARLRRLRSPDDSEILDSALVIWFPGPASFSGEDALEFHLHGSRAVINVVSAALVTLGCRPAGPGEFSRRAFLHGRIDLTAAEGMADLVAAETDAQRRQALRQAEGALAARIAVWDQALTTLLAHQEASIEFAEDGIPNDLAQTIGARIGLLRQQLSADLSTATQAQRLRDGVRVAIVGAPNVGKSSLLNVLAGSEVAIVSHLPGTTRDVVEVRLDLGGVVVMLADTAGLRDTGDSIEAEGIRRARARASQADLILSVSAPGVDEQQVLPPSDAPVIQVWNKADLAPAPENWLGISTLTGFGMQSLTAALNEAVARLAGLSEVATITRSRHRAALLEMDRWLSEAQVASLPEIGAEALRAARHALGRLTGRSGVEEVLDAVFKDFCIGK